MMTIGSKSICQRMKQFRYYFLSSRENSSQNNSIGYYYPIEFKKLETIFVYFFTGGIVYCLTKSRNSSPFNVSASNNRSTIKSIITRLSRIIRVANCSQ